MCKLDCFIPFAKAEKHEKCRFRSSWGNLTRSLSCLKIGKVLSKRWMSQRMPFGKITFIGRLIHTVGHHFILRQSLLIQRMWLAFRGGVSTLIGKAPKIGSTCVWSHQNTLKNIDPRFAWAWGGLKLIVNCYNRHLATTSKVSYLQKLHLARLVTK